ncbi:SLC2A4 regulator isoform X2 [Otolemur garnettii]|uniref:SLC2A4 regulator isoform X2 n=1 Tax=Otolemur garnettii TaxID=30611 RepID=UPI000C7F5E44|nr:SLC2A4 regulator isoform X2 [Otolemur garnettii]
MEAERPPAPGPGYRRLPTRAAGRDPSALQAEAPWAHAEASGPCAAAVTVPTPPQEPAAGGGRAGSELALPREPEPRAADFGAPGTWAGASAAGLPTPSVHIPVPTQRATPEKARLDEVMAAAALTSLSTSPLLLGAPVTAFSPEPGLEPWKEALVQPPGSYSSSNSGEWCWDLASDQSSPSTPSPPLPPEAAHFLFGEPTLRKRKVSLGQPQGEVGAVAEPDHHPCVQSSAQVMFQCLWKSCGKVLSTASGMQRHIRLVHLGRQAEPEQSDGEEDFYYTELDIGVDTLTDRLSSLTPVSPTASMPPVFPRLELPELLEPPALPSLLQPLTLSPHPMLTSVDTPQACHSHHACQVGEAIGGSWGQISGRSGALQRNEVRACVPALATRMGMSLRKPRGDAKKCRKVYGMDHRDLWCTACRWKKACQRFLD